MATETQINVGLRLECGSLGMRNYENDNSTQYKSNRHDLWWVDGNNYQIGTTLPYDVGGTSYSATANALMRRYWDQGWILPLV